jgi:hypothetical protein
MQLDEPIKEIRIDSWEFWDHDGTRPCVRENFKKMIECRTPALGWLLYASETEVRRVYFTCKVRSCPSCGYRATLQWQREQWTQGSEGLERALIGTVAGCDVCRPSPEWLGLRSPVAKVRGSGL